MLQDVCCLFSPICKYRKPLVRLPLEFFLILFMDESMIPVKLYHTCVPRFDFSPSSVNLFCQKQLESWALLSQQDIKIKSCLKLKAQYINKQMILSHKIINAVWDRGGGRGVNPNYSNEVFKPPSEQGCWLFLSSLLVTLSSLKKKNFSGESQLVMYCEFLKLHKV